MTFLIIVLFLIVYFLPTILAYTNNKKNKTTIFLLNFIIGWSAIGWFIALYLALRREKFTINHEFN